MKPLRDGDKTCKSEVNKLRSCINQAKPLLLLTSEPTSGTAGWVAFTFTGHPEALRRCLAISRPVAKLINTELSGSWLANKDNLWPIIFKDKGNYNWRDDKRSKDVI